MLALTVCILLVIVLVVAAWGMSRNYSMWTFSSKSPFECGFDSKQSGHVLFSIRFAHFVLLFLIFDVELIFFFLVPTMFSDGWICVLLLLVTLVLVWGGFLLEEEDMSWSLVQ